jgi:hypothetical protein
MTKRSRPIRLGSAERRAIAAVPMRGTRRTFVSLAQGLIGTHGAEQLYARLRMAEMIAEEGGDYAFVLPLNARI